MVVEMMSMLWGEGGGKVSTGGGGGYWGVMEDVHGVVSVDEAEGGGCED